MLIKESASHQIPISVESCKHWKLKGRTVFSTTFLSIQDQINSEEPHPIWILARDWVCRGKSRGCGERKPEAFLCYLLTYDLLSQQTRELCIRRPHKKQVNDLFLLHCYINELISGSAAWPRFMSSKLLCIYTYYQQFLRRSEDPTCFL